MEPIKPPPRVEPELPEGPEPEYWRGPDGHDYVRFPGGWTPGPLKWFQVRSSLFPAGSRYSPMGGINPGPVWDDTYYLTNLTDDDPWWDAPSGTKLPDYAMREPTPPVGSQTPHPQSIHPEYVKQHSPATEASPGKPRLAMPVREVNTNYSMRDMKLILETFRNATKELLKEEVPWVEPPLSDFEEELEFGQGPVERCKPPKMRDQSGNCVYSSDKDRHGQDLGESLPIEKGSINVHSAEVTPYQTLTDFVLDKSGSLPARKSAYYKLQTLAHKDPNAQAMLDAIPQEIRGPLAPRWERPTGRRLSPAERAMAKFNP